MVRASQRDGAGPSKDILNSDDSVASARPYGEAVQSNVLYGHQETRTCAVPPCPLRRKWATRNFDEGAMDELNLEPPSSLTHPALRVLRTGAGIASKALVTAAALHIESYPRREK